MVGCVALWWALNLKLILTRPQNELELGLVNIHPAKNAYLSIQCMKIFANENKCINSVNSNLLTIFLNSKSELFRADITLIDRNTLLEARI